MWAELVKNDKHMFMVEALPIITIYDDNLFVRNTYDILSFGQRDYLIKFFKQQGFAVKTGKMMVKDDLKLHFPTPNRLLADSNFSEKFLLLNGQDFYFITPTTFAECLFYMMLEKDEDSIVLLLKALINKCPFNVEYLRDIHYRTRIAKLTNKYFHLLSEYQHSIIEEKFKRKRAL